MTRTLSTKFYFLAMATAMFLPCALMAMHQAAQIVA